MLPLLLLAAAVAPARTAIEEERAFAAAAQRDGLWAASLAYADDTAAMFAPQPVSAQLYLASHRDPEPAPRWWPTASYLSCDGSYAVDTGNSLDARGVAGFFSTVWRRQPDPIHWKWTVDSRGTLRTARANPARPVERRASCAGDPPPLPLEHVDNRISVETGASLDGTLRWSWRVDAAGARTFEASVWNGRGFDRVIADAIPAPGAAPSR